MEEKNNFKCGVNTCIKIKTESIVLCSDFFKRSQPKKIGKVLEVGIEPTTVALLFL